MVSNEISGRICVNKGQKSKQNKSIELSVISVISPPRQTKSPDNSNVLLMFNNDAVTDFRTAYKHVLNS